MADSDSRFWWYNMTTGAVEQGFVSASADRVGPFSSREEAAHALERLHENSRRWSQEDAAEDD
ncbi:SPOR domain-containing protein [Rathayibacter toxicus]|uniref:SPOR domain-containing protein n=1 Tax=Rathayibacter toxicus TaxID=145458 RepID=UPI000CE73EEE|nr:SPOR domain-containing protein [Rathayibacter toxicus]PPI55262.1 hypothetical protein C5D35_06000 [Rathayibacter toxicus]QOD09484.1 SPOR domain-containing protein [Rathayibacter toxicus]QWL28153.1 SPOR domain-containing protein [Rathayibacter toxicus]QWL30232.1 SPOR domain-containing protein [Rathayibacter toxicus]QWL32350.1 SPOR domain-containing protein [Rathayibacter toxicus]